MKSFQTISLLILFMISGIAVYASDKIGLFYNNESERARFAAIEIQEVLKNQDHEVIVQTLSSFKSPRKACNQHCADGYQ